LLIAKAGLSIEPVTADQADVARECWRRYGKARHSAGLNFGDCFSYALAKVTREPLLFKGDDFAERVRCQRRIAKPLLKTSPLPAPKSNSDRS
jgi:uncharacterized protein with PIN domain